MAKTLVGALRVTLGLDSAEFASGAAKATAISQRLSKSLMVIGTAVSAVGATIAVGVRRQLNAADDMAKAAQKFGVPIEELSKLAYAGDLTGVSLQALGTGLRGLSKNIAGNEDRFKKLGVAVRDAQGAVRPTTAIVADLADVFAKMPDGAEKTALAMQLFGKSGAEMLPLLNAGAEGIRAMTDEAAAMGLVITEETGRAAEQFNDNLTRLSSTVTGLFRIITAQLAPVLARITDYLVQAAAAFQNLSPEMQTFIGVLAGLTIALGPVLIGLGLVVGALGAIGGPILGVIAAVALLAAGFIAFGEALGITVPSMAELQTFWENLKVIFGNLDIVAQLTWDKLVAMAEGVWSSVSTKFTELGQAAAQLANDFLQMANNAYTWVTTKFDELIAWLAGIPGRIAEIGKEIAGAVAGALALPEGFAEKKGRGYGGLGTYVPGSGSLDPASYSTGRSMTDGIITGAAARMGERSAELAAVMQLGLQVMKDAAQIASPSKVTEEYGRNLAEGLAAGMEAGKDIVGQAAQSLTDTAKGAMKGIGDLGKQIGDMFATAATNVLTGVQSLREAVGQLLQQIAQLLINSAMKQLFGNVFGGLKLGGYATGTMSAARGLAMVGEEGPELVNFRGGERVYNARDTARLARSGEGGGPQPVSMTSNVYLDGELILSRLETPQGEAKIATVLRRIGATA